MYCDLCSTWKVKSIALEYLLYFQLHLTFCTGTGNSQDHDATVLCWYRHIKALDIDRNALVGWLFKIISFIQFYILLFSCLFLQVENLFEGHDFRTKITREEFETMCTDLFDRVASPIETALKAASMKLASSIVITFTLLTIRA